MERTVKYGISLPREVDGFTYVFESRSSGLCRIGWAGNSEWVKTVLRENPDIIVIAMAEGNVIGELYKRYVTKKVSAEWFILTDNDIREINALYMGYTDAASHILMLHARQMADHENRMSAIERRLRRLERV